MAKRGDCPTTCLIDPNLPACIACGFGGKKRDVDGDCPTTCLIDPNLPACVACNFGHSEPNVENKREVEGDCPTTCLIDPSLPACMACGFGGRKRDIMEREAFYCSRQVNSGCNGPPNNYPWKREPFLSSCALDDPDCARLPIVPRIPSYCESHPDSVNCKQIGVPNEKKRHLGCPPGEPDCHPPKDKRQDENRSICPQGEPDCNPFHTRNFPSPTLPIVSAVVIGPPREPIPVFTSISIPTHTIHVSPPVH